MSKSRPDSPFPWDLLMDGSREDIVRSLPNPTPPPYERRSGADVDRVQRHAAAMETEFRPARPSSVERDDPGRDTPQREITD